MGLPHIQLALVPELLLVLVQHLNAYLLSSFLSGFVFKRSAKYLFVRSNPVIESYCGLFI
jgi:hypothetical protein